METLDVPSVRPSVDAARRDPEPRSAYSYRRDTNRRFVGTRPATLEDVARDVGCDAMPTVRRRHAAERNSIGRDATRPYGRGKGRDRAGTNERTGWDGMGWDTPASV